MLSFNESFENVIWQMAENKVGRRKCYFILGQRGQKAIPMLSQCC